MLIFHLLFILFHRECVFLKQHSLSNLKKKTKKKHTIQKWARPQYTSDSHLYCISPIPDYQSHEPRHKYQKQEYYGWIFSQCDNLVYKYWLLIFAFPSILVHKKGNKYALICSSFLSIISENMFPHNLLHGQYLSYCLYKLADRAAVKKGSTRNLKI